LGITLVCRAIQGVGLAKFVQYLHWLLPHLPVLLMGISPIFADIFRRGNPEKIRADWRIKNPNAIAL